MFTPIDYEHWDRREIYETFDGYLYDVTVDLDITHFLERLRERGLKFYPAACYCITRMVNRNAMFRYSKSAGQIGTWDSVDAHYTLMRRGTDLFTHQMTKYTDDFDAFYSAFQADQAAAEAGDRLYFGPSPLNCVHISIVPGLRFRALSYQKPERFTQYGTQNTSFVPFVTMGKYAADNGRMTLPVTVEFHHAVNDGYHAQRFFEELETTLREF